MDMSKGRLCALVSANCQQMSIPLICRLGYHGSLHNSSMDSPTHVCAERMICLFFPGRWSETDQPT